MPAERLPFASGFRSLQVIKPAFPVGSDLIWYGFLMGLKTSPTLLAVGTKAASESNGAKITVAHHVSAAQLTAADFRQTWPMAANGEQLGCVLVNVQLPKAHASVIQSLPPYAVVRTEVGRGLIRDDIHLYVDFSTVHHLVGVPAAVALRSAFAKIYIKHMRGNLTSKANAKRTKQLKKRKIVNENGLLAYWNKQYGKLAVP